MKQKLSLRGFEVGWTIPDSPAGLFTIANSRHIYIPEDLTLYQACRYVISRLIPEDLYPEAEKLFFKKMKIKAEDEIIEKVRELEPNIDEDEEC